MTATTTRPILPLRRLSAAFLGLSVLAACASEPAPTVSGAWGGTWVVTDAFPAGAVTDAQSAPRGQRVRLDAAMAGEPGGGQCPAPVYGEATATLGEVLGLLPPGEARDRLVGVLRVDCAGIRLSSYAVMADGSLMTRFGPWLLRLEHGETLAANPAPMMPEPAMALTPPPVAVAAPPAAPPVLVYLASYRTEAWAKKGWGILATHSASLKGLEPVTRPVDIKGKGTFIRLFAPARDSAQGKAICKELGRALSDCGATDRGA